MSQKFNKEYLYTVYYSPFFRTNYTKVFFNLMILKMSCEKLIQSVIKNIYIYMYFWTNQKEK